jgi:hypothetical protein
MNGRHPGEGLAFREIGMTTTVTVSVQHDAEKSVRVCLMDETPDKQNAFVTGHQDELRAGETRDYHVFKERRLLIQEV